MQIPFNLEVNTLVHLNLGGADHGAWVRDIDTEGERVLLSNINMPFCGTINRWFTYDEIVEIVVPVVPL